MADRDRTVLYRELRRGSHFGYLFGAGTDRLTQLDALAQLGAQVIEGAMGRQLEGSQYFNDWLNMLRYWKQYREENP